MLAKKESRQRISLWKVALARDRGSETEMLAGY